MALIELRGLVKRYGRVTALGGLDLALEGGVIGLLGPNGAGKSTLVRILLGLIPPTAGSATVFGIPVDRRPLDVRRRIGHMPEHESLIPGFDGVASVYVAGRLNGMAHSEAMRRAHLVLNYVGLGEERHRRVETYSSGMKQKVKLAQALVHHPRLLVLDEPTAGLDPRTRVEVLDLIRDAARTGGMDVLLSTHVLPDVERLCGRVVLLDRGRLVANGTLSELQVARGAGWEVMIRGDMRAFVDALSRRHLEAADAVDGKLQVRARDGGSDARPILEAAAETGVQLRALRPARSTLEDMFALLVAESRSEGERS